MHIYNFLIDDRSVGSTKICLIIKQRLLGLLCPIPYKQVYQPKITHSSILIYFNKQYFTNRDDK